MKEFYTLQADDYNVVSNTTFQLSSSGSVVKYDPASTSTSCNAIGALRLNTGTAVIWKAFRNSDIYNPTEPWASLTDMATNKAMRHCYGKVWESNYMPNTVDFAWIFYKQNDGTYYIFNPFNNGLYLSYDSGSDSLTISTTPFNWTITPVQLPAVAPAAPPAAPPEAQVDPMYYIGGGILMSCCCLILMVLILKK
jgi:hypothetical protein